MLTFDTNTVSLSTVQHCHVPTQILVNLMMAFPPVTNLLKTMLCLMVLHEAVECAKFMFPTLILTCLQ